ncbi:hypothetical protein ebA627 [Aromatoleum aromaticum EbN1]|uniref:Uncharacterized protein n=1 Tax=Aromatoleum aromaticum (strain DSM 19018 / LMG 30748 / EbN1) TaxID=76114 RepID=Q5P8B1_AROAE|nr:hypothetical protein ebA627 [Aromatoleum aromaticum EbN1]
MKPANASSMSICKFEPPTWITPPGAGLLSFPGGWTAASGWSLTTEFHHAMLLVGFKFGPM